MPSRRWKFFSSKKMIDSQPDPNIPTTCPIPRPSRSLSQTSGGNTLSYTRLSNDGSDIRLLRIEPRTTFGNTEEPMRCELKVFARTTAPQYQALSYMWGQRSPVFTIIVNGCRFQVRKNLQEFLLAARRNSWIKTWIWIDQLCIDQTNVSERSSQVQRMGTTYKDAEEVLIWLGDHAWHGDVAIEKMRSEFATSYERHQVDPEDDVQRIILTNLYWSRIWIVQEIHFACRLSILCSNSRLPWSEVDLSKNWWSTPSAVGHEIMSEKLSDAFGEAYVSIQDRASANQGYYGLFMAINGCLGTGCEEPRDKVFALMNIVKSEERVVVDYTKSTEEVYLATLHKILEICSDSHPRFTLFTLLKLAVEMKLLGDVDVGDKDSLVDKLYVVVEGKRADCRRPLPVVMDLVYRSGELAPLEFKPSYGDELHSYEDIRERQFDDGCLSMDQGWRYDLNLAELHQRLELYNKILNVRKHWKLTDKCFSEGCWNLLVPLYLER